MKTLLTNYMNRHNVTCEVLNNINETQECSLTFVVRQDYYIDVYKFGQFIKTVTSHIAARAVTI